MRIVLTGGGTAGHCMPNLALLPFLRKDFSEIFYIGSKTGTEKTLVKNAGLPYYEIPTCKLRRALTAENLKIPFVLIKSVKESEKLLETLRPDVVFSKGGYVGLPAALACKRLKIPLVCHESDRSMGLSNKIAARSATVTLTAFPIRAKNMLLVGTPLREELFSVPRSAALSRYGFSGKKPVLLVVGGSSGALALNRALLRVLPRLTDFDVLHLTGKKNTLPLPDRAGYVAVPFEEKPEYAYAAADFALSRAGANALFELLALGIPTLAVPLATGRGDQKENAAFFEKKGALLVLNEQNLDPDVLLFRLLALKKNAAAIRERIRSLQIENASEKIEKILKKVAETGEFSK